MNDAVEVLGSTTEFWTYGPADAAVTLIFIHGYRGEHHGLEPVIAHLRGLRIIAPDLPGFGRSEPLVVGHHDIDGYAAWLGAFVGALGLERATVLGHSFGSIVVAHAAADGLISPPRLILVNPIASPAASGPNRALTRLAVFGIALAGRLPARLGRWLVGNRAVVRGMSLVMTTTKDPVLRRFIHDQHATYFSDFASSATVVEGFEASVSHNVAEVASRIDIPTLLIGAELDPITPVADVAALERAMPQATLRMIPGVGHLVHYEKSREAAELIVDWLGEGRAIG
ncbi:alpha/beta hydrolase [soil metagenome]